MRYEILEHTAELRLRIYGKTLEELFSNAAGAMADILAQNVNRKAPIATKEIIKLQSPDINSLLVDFLSEILAKSQINKKVYKVKSLKLKGKGGFETELIGYPINRFDEDIKAVTYQDLNIQKIKETWQTDLVFDI